MAVDPGAPAVVGDSQTKDVISTINLKTFGDNPSLALGLAQQGLAQAFTIGYQNAVDEQQNQRAFNRAVNGAVINTLLANNVVQGLVDTNVSNSDLAKQLSQYQASLNSGNQGLAGVQQSAGIASDTNTAGLAQA